MLNNRIQPIPEQWLPLLAPGGSHAISRTSGVISIQSGERHMRLFYLGCSLRGKGRELEDIQTTLLTTNREQCAPPLPEDEVRAIAVSIVSQYPAGAGKGASLSTLADQIISQNQFLTRSDESVYRFNGRIWESVADLALKVEVDRLDLPDIKNKKRLDDVIHFIKVRTYREAIVWNNLPIGEIPFRNAVLNIHTNELREHRAEDYLETTLPYDYCETAECPTWENQYLATCFEGDPERNEKIQAIEEFLGYLLLRQAPYKKAFIAFGKGDTGKTELSYVMENLVGKENVCNISLEHMGSPRKLAPLRGKSLNLISELQNDTDIEDAGFKRLVSTGESMQLDAKYKDPIQYTPFCKHAIFTNNLPPIHDASGAIFNRLLIIEFLNQIPPERRDPAIRDRLKAEVSGILLKAIAGLRRLIANEGRFTTPSSSLCNVEQYRQDSNPMHDFLDTCFVEQTDSRTDMKDVRAAYNHYAPSSRLAPGKITRLLRSTGCEVQKTSVNGTKGSYLIGYKLTPDMRFRLGIPSIWDD